MDEKGRRDEDEPYNLNLTTPLVRPRPQASRFYYALLVCFCASTVGGEPTTEQQDWECYSRVT